MSQVRTYTWALKPAAAGPAEIGPVNVRYSGGETKTAPVTLEVVAGSVKPKSASRPRSAFGDPFAGDPLDEMFGRGGRAEGKLFLETSPSRRRLHVGEALLVSYFVYAKDVQPTDLQAVGTPQYPGFWAENLEDKSAQPEAVKVEGETYGRYPIYRKLLFPTRAGTLTIPALTLRIGLARRSFFDPGSVVERSTKPVEIVVEPLPDAPGFSGAVGRFKVEALLDRPSVPLGEAVTIRYRIEGTGNLKWVEEPPRLELAGAKIFPPQVKTDLKATPSGLTGSKTWEFVAVPETSGTLLVPRLPFTYFDSGTGRVATLETAPLEVAVLGGAPAGSPAAAAAPARAPRHATALALRDAVDGGAGPASLSPRGLALVLGGLLALHLGMAAAGRFGGLFARGPARAEVRSALQDLAQAAEPGRSKEEAAALIERALHETMRARDGRASASERQALERLIQDVQAVRYAPQLGDYSETVRDLARRARAAVERSR
jgi:hypothetical protein